MLNTVTWPFPAEDGRVHVGLTREHTGVVHEVTGGEVVGAVGNDVVVLEQLERVLAVEHGLVLFDLHVGVERVDALLRRVELRLSHVFGAMHDLALEVRLVDDVEVHDAETAYPRRRQVHAQRRAEPASTDTQHAGRLELLLPLHPDRREDEMAAVALDLFFGELDALGGDVEVGGDGFHVHESGPSASWAYR